MCALLKMFFFKFIHYGYLHTEIIPFTYFTDIVKTIHLISSDKQE